MTVWSRIAASAIKLGPPTTTEVAVERDLAAKMPDGAVLLADRWYATEPGGPQPTVLVRTPYGRWVFGPIGRLYAERGYQVVLQSCRGTFGSEGDFEAMRNEQADGMATIEWVRAQPWFDGRLVTWGASYLGLTQWAVAQDAPGELKALSLSVTTSQFRDMVYPGGAYGLDTVLTWMHQVAHQESGWRGIAAAQVRAQRQIRAAAGLLPLESCDTALIGRPAQFFQDQLAHDAAGDPWWDSVDFGRRLGAVPPASMVGGWYDIFLPYQVADYEALRAAGRPARLTVGPWTHTSLGGHLEGLRDGLDWFDEQLGTHRGPPRSPVRVFVMGSEKWEEFEHWPPAAEAQHWYLGRWGVLTTEPPDGSAPDRFTYNPRDPTPAVGGASLNMLNAGRKDQGRRETRHDVVTYTGPVLTEDLTVIGPLRATVYLRSSLEHTDVVLRLCDVDHRGRSHNLSDGVVRLTPGSVEQDEDGVRTVTVSMWPTANTFRKGHRIRLQVSSGAHPLFARNTGSGEPLGSATTMRSADQEVFHDVARPSHIVLPVVPVIA